MLTGGHFTYCSVPNWKYSINLIGCWGQKAAAADDKDAPRDRWQLTWLFFIDSPSGCIYDLFTLIQIRNKHYLELLTEVASFKMMNEGLDALATLASTSPSAPTWSDSGPHSNNYSSQGTNEIPFSAHGSNGNTSVSTSRGSAAAAPVGSYPVFSASNLMQMLQNGRLSKLQQALQQCGNETNNPSAISNNNLALLMGMQQRQPQPQADQLALLQLQLSYYNSNTNRQSGNQMNAGTGDRAVQHPNTTSFEPHQELALSQALQAHQRAQQNGKFFSVMHTVVFRDL